MARSEKTGFEGSQGDELAASLELPADEPVAYALFAHCFTCSKDTFAASRISRALTDHGIAVLRFDFTGLGSSGGDFANTGFSSNVEDLVRAAGHLRETHAAPTLLIGHSLGGAAVLMAASRIPEAAAVATIAAPFDPVHVTELFADSVDRIEREGSGEVEIGGRRFTIRREFLADASEQNMTDALAGLARPLIVFHSPLDDQVGVDNARRIFEGAKHPKSFVSLDDADHLLTRRSDASYVADILAAWAGRYVAAGQGAGETPAEGYVVVAETGEGKGFAQQVRAGHHALRADEPEPTGDDTGPSPYDLLLAGLGACTSMTLRMYAERKGWPLEHVSVRLRHERVHASDCEDCEERNVRISRIERTLELVGELDDDQRQRLREIAERCPVHRTLMEDKQIVTTLAGADGSA